MFRYFKPDTHTTHACMNYKKNCKRVFYTHIICVSDKNHVKNIEIKNSNELINYKKCLAHA